VDPTLEEIDYEEEEDKDEDSEYSPNEDFYKSNLFDSDDDNVSLGLSEYHVPSARGVGSGDDLKLVGPINPTLLL